MCGIVTFAICGRSADQRSVITTVSLATKPHPIPSPPSVSFRAPFLISERVAQQLVG
jgi:hypothetical protein